MRRALGTHQITLANVKRSPASKSRQKEEGAATWGFTFSTHDCTAERRASESRAPSLPFACPPPHHHHHHHHHHHQTPKSAFSHLSTQRGEDAEESEGEGGHTWFKTSSHVSELTASISWSTRLFGLASKSSMAAHSCNIVCSAATRDCGYADTCLSALELPPPLYKHVSTTSTTSTTKSLQHPRYNILSTTNSLSRCVSVATKCSIPCPYQQNLAHIGFSAENRKSPFPPFPRTRLSIHGNQIFCSYSAGAAPEKASGG